MKNNMLVCASFLLAFLVHADEPVLTSLPYHPGLDMASMNKAIDPCEDFYQYSCGGWIKNNPIPDDHSSWDVYAKLAQDNQRFLYGILQTLSANEPKRNANQAKIGDYFAACMDEAAAEKAQAAPLKDFFTLIDAVKTRDDLAPTLGRLQRQLPHSDVFFSFGADQDFANSQDVIAFASAGGLGLPDRDYYFKKDAKSRELREKYLKHIQKMFTLAGQDEKSAKKDAATVMKIETALAKDTLTRVERRNPYNLFHKMDAAGLKKSTPHFSWTAYLSTLWPDAPSLNVFNMTEPKFFKGLDKLLNTAPVADLRTYMRWHAVSSMASLMSAAFVNADFDFYSKTLRGTKELPPRWKRCERLVDSQLGEALGQEFVQRTFSPALKQKVLHMTEQVEKAMREDISQLTWMTPETKKKAAEKLDTLVNKIGYPDHWRDYSAFNVQRADFAGNVQRGHDFEFRRDLNKIGKPLDRTEWNMTPPTVNAYYDPQLNDINFPAGVLQPPLYDGKMDDAPNYGNTGGTIGHELTHAFDDEGRKFNAKGDLKDWWTKDDAKAFDQRAGCIVDQYKNYTVIDNIKINSKLTEGEDIADLGGLMLAWIAWKAETANTKLETREGLSPEQRFFVGYAQWVCGSTRPEQLRLQAATDEHSPGEYRVNGLVVNIPEFAKAFNCKAGQKMVSAKTCRIW